MPKLTQNHTRSLKRLSAVKCGAWQTVVFALRCLLSRLKTSSVIVLLQALKGPGSGGMVIARFANRRRAIVASYRGRYTPQL